MVSRFYIDLPERIRQANPILWFLADFFPGSNKNTHQTHLHVVGELYTASIDKTWTGVGHGEFPAAKRRNVEQYIP
jgi:hypothetical protein